MMKKLNFLNCEQAFRRIDGWAPRKMQSMRLWRRLSSASPSAWNVFPPRNEFPNNTFCEGSFQIVSCQPAAAARPLYDVLEMEDWPEKFSALVEKLQQHGVCALRPDEPETNLFNQQKFLLNSNQGAPA